MFFLLGGLQVLIDADVDIDLKVLGNLSNGIEILIRLLISINGKLDVGKLLGSILNDIGALLNLLTKLGKGLDCRINGLIKVQ